MAKKRKAITNIPKKVKKQHKPENIDLLDFPEPNLNKSHTVVLADERAADVIMRSDIFPPDPCDLFDKEDIDAARPESVFWQLMEMAALRFPLLSLRICWGPNGESGEETMAFIDPKYGCTNPPIGGIAPPTWMDPEVFVRMMMADEAVKTLADEAVRNNSFKRLADLEQAIEQVFLVEYINYIGANFERVRRLLARWAIAKRLWDSKEGANYRPGMEKTKRVKAVK